MAVHNQQPVCTHTTRLSVGIKVLQPGKTKLVRRPAVRTDFDDPVSGQIVKPGRDQDLAREDKKGWQSLAFGADSLDVSDPPTVARLDPL